MSNVKKGTRDARKRQGDGETRRQAESELNNQLKIEGPSPLGECDEG